MAFFQTSGILPDSQTCSNMAVKYDCRCGECLNTEIDIWSNGQRQPDDFIFLITFVTSWYVGGLVLNAEDRESNRGIQLSVLKNTFGLIFLKTFLKYVVQTFLLNDGKILLLVFRNFLAHFQTPECLINAL